MPEKIILNDGTEFDYSSAILSGDLFLYLRGKTMTEVFNKLDVPQNTSSIQYVQMNGNIVTYEGFVKLIAVRDEGNGLISAVMNREVNVNA